MWHTATKIYQTTLQKKTLLIWKNTQKKVEKCIAKVEHHSDNMNRSQDIPPVF
jgi:hypothetical protein